MLIRAMFITLALLLSFAVTPAQTRKANPPDQNFGQIDNLSNDKVTHALRSALEIGTGNAVSQVGRPDGFFRNAIIRILMPRKLQAFEKALRAVGYGQKVDEFILSMNRAAENASPQARRIFINAIREMSIDDARKILTGGDTSATDFFKAKTSGSLGTIFRPIIEKSMNEVGATRKYKDLIAKYQGLPFISSQALDIDDYVLGKTLDGLFYMVGEEEMKIRKNPAARVTRVLKDVFGSIRR